MSDEVLEETCSVCGVELVRTPADDKYNPHNGAAVSCPGCMELKRIE